MIPAVAPSSHSDIPQVGPLQSRDRMIARYRHLREISKVHHQNAMTFLSGATIRQHARRLDLSHGRRLILDSEDELTLVLDLAIHTASPGRTRAIDRLAKNLPPQPGTDEARVLHAMRHARFAVLLMECRHPIAGVVLADLFRDEQVWLVDEALETWLEKGMALATRYCKPEVFSMALGATIPVHRSLLEDAVDSVPPLTRKPKAQAIDDPRFAEAIYRVGIAEGVMENVRYVDPPAAGYAA